MKSTIAHVNQQFFAKSETFLYFYLESFKDTIPVCVCWYPIINTDLFPFPNENLLSLYPRQYSPAWIIRGFAKRILGIYLDRKIALKWLHEKDANLIHAHYGPVGWWSLELKKQLKVPLVTTFYGYDLAPDLKEISHWQARRKELFSTGDLFLVEGPFMRNRLIELGCPPEKIDIQRIALPLQNTPYRDAVKKTDRPTTLLFAGRFVEKKGIMDAVIAVQQTIQAGYPVEFRLIGNGPLYAQVQQYVQSQGLQNHIKFLGFLNHADYLKELNKADIFIHPSVFAQDGDSEGGAPTTILEASATGLPILSTDHADIPYIVDHNRTGILVHQRQIDELTQALIYLIENPQRWIEMGRQGRKKMEQEHDIAKEAALLEYQYAALIKKSLS